LYDNGPHYALSVNEAVDSLAETFSLGRTRKARLRRDQYLELNPSRDGADYAEITACSDACNPADYDYESPTTDDTDDDNEPHSTPCPQCSACMVNGLFCHEQGCPLTGARYDAETGEFVKQRKCFDCGCTVDADDPCCQRDSDAA